jgi:hypothetical protein
MLFLKGQIMLVKSDYKKTMMRDDGETYTYVIPRLDGTVILGGIRDPDIRYDECWTCSLAWLTTAVRTAIRILIGMILHCTLCYLLPVHTISDACSLYVLPSELRSFQDPSYVFIFLI